MSDDSGARLRLRAQRSAKQEPPEVNEHLPAAPAAPVAATATAAAAVDEEQPSLLVLCVFLSFFAVCGALWFFTSRVQRSTLPSLAALEYDAQALTTRVQPIHLLAASTSGQIHSAVSDAIGRFVDTLPHHLASAAPDGYTLSVTWAVTQAPLHLPLTEMPSLLFDLDDVLSGAVQRLADSLTTTASDAAFVLPPLYIFVIDAPTAPASLKERWWMGRYRHAFGFLSPSDGPSQLTAALQRSVSLLTAMFRHHTTRSSDARLLTYQPEYRLSFTLLTSRPAPWTYSWDFAAVHALHLAPLLNATSRSLRLSTDSQSLQYFDLLPGGGQVVTEEALVDLVGRMGWMLASPLAKHSVELVAYIPEAGRRGMKVRGKDGVDVESFIVPGWGGMTIVNEALEDEEGDRAGGGAATTVKELGERSAAAVMGRLIALVRVMLGLPEEVYAASLSSPAASDFALLPSSAYIAQWESDVLFARFLTLSVQSALHDLHALINLVDTVPHMPVNESIAELVHDSIDAAAAARAHCAEGRWQQCGEAALRCSRSAHDAFYAESLLPTLYFPEEHVYAVYAPLFVPIGLPVLGAVLARVRNWRRRRSTSKAKLQ